MNYSQEELNQILLSKSIGDFYLALIENNGELITDEEYRRITKRTDNTYSGSTKEDIEDLSRMVQQNEVLKDHVTDFMKMVYSVARIRHIAIITVIGDEVYDIGSCEFIDFRRNKIVHYDSFTNYYNETNARIRFFTPEEEPRLEQDTVLMDVDDESIIYAYEQEHIDQEESDDLTSQFFDDFKCKPRTKRPINN